MNSNLFSWNVETSFTRISVKNPTFTTTPHGLLTELPIIKTDFGWSIALLGWSIGGRRMGLILSKLPESFLAGLPHPLYHVGTWARFDICRLIPVDAFLVNMRRVGRAVSSPKWRKIYISLRPIPGAVHIPMMFRYPPYNLIQARDAYALKLCRVSPLLPWAGSSPIALTFRGPSYQFCIRAGRCNNSPEVRGQVMKQGAHWATLHFLPSDSLESEDSAEHVCVSDHIGRWKDGHRAFSLPNIEGEIILAFTPCHYNPADTLTINVSYSSGTTLPTSEMESHRSLSALFGDVQPPPQRRIFVLLGLRPKMYLSETVSARICALPTLSRILTPYKGGAHA